MKIFIKTVPGRETATKMHEWRDNKSGKSLRKSKQGGCKDVYCPMHSRKIGALNTGALLDIVDNPYFGEDKSKLGKGWEYLSDKKEITRQELLEKKHGREPGFYTNRSYRKGDKDRTFMQTLKLPLNDGTTIWDTNNPIDEIRYFVTLKHPFVAASLEEYHAHKKPKATHYIALQDEDVEVRVKQAKSRNKAIARLEDEDFIDDNKLLVLKALGWNNRQYTMRGKDMYDLINDKIAGAKLNEPDNDIVKFNKIYDLLKDEVGRKELSTRAFLQDLLDTRVVSNYKETYTWISKGIVLGSRKDGEDSVLEYLTDDTKQVEHKQLKAAVDASRI